MSNRLWITLMPQEGGTIAARNVMASSPSTASLAQQELEVLQAIYADERDVIDIHPPSSGDDDDSYCLSYTFRSTVVLDSEETAATTISKHTSSLYYLEVRIPLGYPEQAVPHVRVLDRVGTAQRQLTRQLVEVANGNRGSETVLDLIQALQSQQGRILEDEQQHQVKQQANREIEDNTASTNSDAWTRAWIWVHHITDTNRCKAIRTEATARHLSGCLKVGYPGIVLIEGPSQQCDDFISWIKGNKSRPDGGFGRQWGHHVRGQIPLDDGGDDKERRRFALSDRLFCVFDTMKQLGAFAQEHDLQDEFCVHVLQHHHT